MKSILKTGLITLLILLLAGLAGVLLWKTKTEAHNLITSPKAERSAPTNSPDQYGMDYEDVTTVNADGQTLVGWYIPSQNGALIIMQHGYKSDRAEMLNEAEMMARRGYGVLISSIRAHDLSDGEQITFGKYEVHDLDAWYQYLMTRSDFDHEKIGILGNSYGGMLAIEYAAQNPQIKAVAADCAFSSLNDTVATSVKHFTGLPEFPFVPLIVFWAERETGFKAADIDATKWIAQISPRPVFLMQGGADTVISASSGQKLYDAAKEPKELWFDPALGHVEFDTKRASEFNQRLGAFFDKYLLGK